MTWTQWRHRSKSPTAVANLSFSRDWSRGVCQARDLMRRVSYTVLDSIVEQSTTHYACRIRDWHDYDRCKTSAFCRSVTLTSPFLVVDVYSQLYCNPSQTNLRNQRPYFICCNRLRFNPETGLFLFVEMLQTVLFWRWRLGNDFSILATTRVDKNSVLANQNSSASLIFSYSRTHAWKKINTKLLDRKYNLDNSA